MNSQPGRLAVSLERGASTTALVYSADRPADAALILGHGAGAGQHSSFLIEFAEAIARLGVDAITFNFLYAEQRRRLPDRAPELERCYRVVIDRVREEVAAARQALFIGGKSMGGRIATQVAATHPDLLLSGPVVLGYPLHPPGRPTERRDAHLRLVHRPMLFLQGSRDSFGGSEELAPLVRELTPACTLHVVEGGDHSFKLSRKDPARQAAVHEDLQRAIAGWIGGITQAAAL